MASTTVAIMRVTAAAATPPAASTSATAMGRSAVRYFAKMSAAAP